ncbi:MAG: nucleotidyltransferase domain-containing protein [Planctomycetota bacterium]
MIARKHIRDFARRVAGEFSPERIVLFGSHARGNASEDSDVDLLVIMRTRKRPTEQALEIRRLVSRRFPLDLLVRTPRDVARRLELKDCFLTSILAEGETLYESRG